MKTNVTITFPIDTNDYNDANGILGNISTVEGVEKLVYAMIGGQSDFPDGVKIEVIELERDVIDDDGCCSGHCDCPYCGL